VSESENCRETVCNRSEIEPYTKIFEKLSMSCCKSFGELESYTEIFELSVSLLSRRISSLSK
jgi:hypothetical protein